MYVRQDLAVIEERKIGDLNSVTSGSIPLCLCPFCSQIRPMHLIITCTLHWTITIDMPPSSNCNSEKIFSGLKV